MPYVFDQAQDPKEQKPGGSGGLALSTTPPPTLGAGNSGQAPGSGKFVNFDRIFNANASGAQQMADSATQNIGGMAESAQNAVADKEKSFGEAVQTGTQVGQTQFDASKTPGQRYSHTPGSYTGPASFDAHVGEQGMSDLRGGVQNAQDNLNLTKDYYGVQTYLQNQHGGQGNYTQGMSVWDAALTGAAGMGQFANLRNKYAGLGGVIDGALTRGQATVGDAQEAAAGPSSVTMLNYKDGAESREEAEAEAKRDVKKVRGGAKKRPDDGTNEGRTDAAAGRS